MRKVTKLKNNIVFVGSVVAGAILRIYFGLTATPTHFQHDVVSDNGHFYYALHFFNNLKLANHFDNQFYQGPLNAIIQSLWMRICSLFIKPVSTNDKYFLELYKCCNILSILYSCLVLYFIIKIVNEFNISKLSRTIIVSICALYPGMILMASQYNNDGLAYVFFFLSLYLGIKWSKNQKMSTIIFLAISIGLGMLAKISVGFIAFIIGPMMLCILIRRIFISCDRKNRCGCHEGSQSSPVRFIILQLIVFIIIVFPLGLSFALRNYFVLHQSLTFVPPMAANTILDVSKKNIVDRFLSFPINRLFVKKHGFFHDVSEYNIWIDLLKTSSFEQFNYSESISNVLAGIILILNLLFYFFGLLSLVFLVVKLLFKKYKSDINLLLISTMLILLAIITYVSFNISHPYSCTSSYRYVLYITFAFAGLIALSIEQILSLRKE